MNSSQHQRFGMQAQTGRRPFPTQAEAATAIAALRRQTWAIAIARRHNKIPSDAALWSQLDEADQLQLSGSAESRHFLNSICNQVRGIDGYDVLKIYGETSATKPDEDAEAARFYGMKADGLAWVETLTAEQYAKFAQF
jgi:hypothetical protein